VVTAHKRGLGGERGQTSIVGAITSESRQVRTGRWTKAEREWAALFARAPHASPYLASAWVSSYVDTFAGVLPCEQLLVRNQYNELIASCLLTKRVDRRALLPLRRAYLNTAGERDADSVVVEHNGVLCCAVSAAPVYEQLALHIEQSSVDEFQLSGGTEEAVTLMLGALPHWRGDIEWRESPCVDLAALRGAGGDHLAVISRNTREQLRRSLRKYGEIGGLIVDAAASLSEAHAMFDEMVLLHEARWQSLGQRGGFASPVRRDFHRLFIERAFPVGQVQLLRVRAGDRVLGVLYNLVANGHVCFYQSGLRFDDSNHLKPGLVAHHLAIQHCLRAGYDLYDFLPSSPGEGRYKNSLANTARRLGTVLLQRPGWRRQWFGMARAARWQWTACKKN